MSLRSVELFTGAGGLALGLDRAGFQHDLMVEWDAHACSTLTNNWDVSDRLYQGDVRHVDFTSLQDDIDLLAGGPPCQPFSLGGNHQGPLDPRDMFPEMIRAVRELRPKTILVENVKGLLRSSFARYFQYILLQFSHPELVARPAESWLDHWARLEQHRKHGLVDRPPYRMQCRLVNAADYGIPQRRQRVFIVGFRSDLGIDWAFPEPTHSAAALHYQQWVTGEYWERHGIPRPMKIPHLNVRDDPPPDPLPWQTVRDAIGDLPNFELRPDAEGWGHGFIPGARSYSGHTGSSLDAPSKTLKAGVHGVPGGENTVQCDDGSVRYYTIREAARLQTFPDTYQFTQSWAEHMRQLGNAVPVDLAYHIAQSIQNALTQGGINPSPNTAPRPATRGPTGGSWQC